MAKKKDEKLVESLSQRSRLILARSFLSYWWVKDQALKMGRMKSCRRSKHMDLQPVLEAANQERAARSIASKLQVSTTRDHHKNLRHIIENNEFIKRRDVFTDVDADTRTTRIKVFCTRRQSLNNYVLSIITQASNLPTQEASKYFLTGDGPASFSFNYVGPNTNQRQKCDVKSMQRDYEHVQAFLRKLKHTIELCNRVAAVLPDVESYYYFTPRRRQTRIEFKGITDDNCTAEAVLESAFVITGADDHEPIFQPGAEVEPDQILQIRTRQQELDEYVRSVILPRRRRRDVI